MVCIFAIDPNPHFLYSMKKPYSLALIFGLLLPCIGAAQLQNIRATSPNGKIRKIQLDVTRINVGTHQAGNLRPALIILNTEVVQAPEFLRDDFHTVVEAENSLFQYRYLHNICEAETFTAKAQATERQMLNFRSEVHAGNLISAQLERELQVKLQKYFSAPVCYAYRINRSSENTLSAIGRKFNMEWVVSPVALHIDTLSGQIITQLQIEVWDMRADTLAIQKVVEGKAIAMDQSISMSVNKASDYLVSKLLTDSEYRVLGKQSFVRRKHLQNLLTEGEQTEWIGHIIDEHGVNSEFIGALANESKDRFFALTMRSYTPDFKDKIPDQMMENPFPEIDVTRDMDPQRAHFRTTTYVGIKWDQKWLVKPVMEDFIYTDNESEARQIYLARFENLGLFEPGEEKLKGNYWERGFLKPLDTATLQFRSDTSVVKDWKRQLAIDKLNLSPYQGLPVPIARELLREYAYTTAIRWEKNMSDQYLKSIFKELALKRAFDIKHIDTDVHRYEMIHDYGFTRALIPVWVKEGWGKEALRFFYWEEASPEVLYEWTYLPKEYFDPVSNKRKGMYIYDQMNLVMPWNYHVAAIFDKGFWEKYVTAKEGRYHKYLVRLTD